MSVNTSIGAFALRIARNPLTRLIVLSAVMFALIAVGDTIKQKFAAQPFAALGLMAIVCVFAFAVYYNAVRWLEQREVTELSLSRMPAEFGLGVLIGAGLYTLCVAILVVMGIYRIDGFNPITFMLPAMAMALGSGVLEELIFRALLFRIVEESLGSWIALAVSSLVFGFAHLLNPQGSLMGALFISVEAGVLLGAAYMLTRRLWASIGFHVAWNYTQSGIFSGIVSGNEAAPGLIRSTIEGPKLLTGGSFGLESSLIAFMLCTTTGIVMLVLAVKRGNVVLPFWKRR
jgi:uncharacterized protein